MIRRIYHVSKTPEEVLAFCRAYRDLCVAHQLRLASDQDYNLCVVVQGLGISNPDIRAVLKETMHVGETVREESPSDPDTARLYGSMSTAELKGLHRAFLKDWASAQATVRFAEGRMTIINQVLAGRPEAGPDAE